MDNPPSSQQLQVPAVPVDFNGGVGIDFAKALLGLLSGARITDAGGPTQSDITQLQNEVEGLNNTVTNNIRNQTKVTMNGVNNGQVVVPFQGWADTNYEITHNIIIGDGVDPATIVVFLIEDSREANQFTVRVDGAGAAFTIEFVITQIRTSGV